MILGALAKTVRTENHFTPGKSLVYDRRNENTSDEWFERIKNTKLIESLNRLGVCCFPIKGVIRKRFATVWDFNASCARIQTAANRFHGSDE